MRISNPYIETYKTTDRKTKKEVTRYRLRWRFYPRHGERGRDCKVSGFVTKGLAEAHRTNCLSKAQLGVDGWSFDDKGYPQQVAEATQAREATALDLITAYLNASWRDRWVAGSRTRIRGRLLSLAALAVDDPQTGLQIKKALEANARKRKAARPVRTLPEKVAAYLRNEDTFRARLALSDEQLGPDLAAGRRWLEQHSLPLSALNHETLGLIRGGFLGNVSASTAVNYWSVASSCFAWGQEVGMLDRDPEVGLAKLKQNGGTERVDPRRVPGVDDVLAIADGAAERAGRCASTEAGRNLGQRSTWMFVVVMAFCALRIGEALGLRRSDIAFTDDGGAWITIERQDDEQVAADSDDGMTTFATAAPKGMRVVAPTKTMYLAPRWATPLKALLDDHVGPESDARVFRNRLGRRINEGVFRQQIWTPTVAELFPDGHRLHGITPHALRAAGMTLWLRARVPFKTIQQWGGWASLKVMLDTYSGVLADDQARAVEAVLAATSEQAPPDDVD